ncbi:MAG TPA: glycosyltransferase family 2 protein [Anaerolineae bacterium]|nr:glycosyltransferase family 2 protein [Anaerolineae bacterium]
MLTQSQIVEPPLRVQDQFISIIIPAFNEEEGIGPTLATIFQTMDAAHYDYEVIVVNDGSTDHTPDEAKKFPRATVLNHPRNRGSGASTNTGVRHARGEIIVMTDGDGTYPVQDIPRLLAEMDEYDMVIGARTRETGTLKVLRTPAKWFIRSLASYLTETKIPDLNSGLRAFKKSNALKYAHILPRGQSWVSTITLAHLSDDLEVKWIPIDYYERKGHSKFRPVQDTYNYLMLVLRTVMYFNPIKILFPIGLLILIIGIIRQLWWFAIGNLVVHSSNVLLVLTGLNIIMMALLADLVVRRARQ